jgi:SPP1 gp7 family putative phage head morphogenesis protein
MPTTTRGRIYDLAEDYRNALEHRNQAAADRLATSWAQVASRLQADTTDLLGKIEAARAAGTPVKPAWLYQQRRLSSLTDAIVRETAEWAPYASSQVRAEAQRTVSQAQVEARNLAREAASTNLPGVAATFTGLNTENLATILGHLQPGGPLDDLMMRLGGEAAEQAASVLVHGLTTGKGSAWITRGLAQALDVPRWRAETIARTEALRAYRETSRQTYARSNVVGSWVWTAYIDRRTCVCCVVMNGSEHPVTETLDGHPRCRCAMVPKTKTWAELGLDPSLDTMGPPKAQLLDGKTWLANQPEGVQLALMGPGKHRAWKSGEITLDDMVARTHSDAWGSMRRERSLKEIRLGKNPNHLPDLPASSRVLPVDTKPKSKTPKARKPKRATAAQARELTCPYCHARPGAKCIQIISPDSEWASQNGKPMHGNGIHAERLAAAQAILDAAARA